MKAKALGRYIVIDPKICHGKPTFRGTRIRVADVLDQVTSGMDWQTIEEEWRGSVAKEAIVEAVRLDRELLVTHGPNAPAKRFVFLIQAFGSGNFEKRPRKNFPGPPDEGMATRRREAMPPNLIIPPTISQSTHLYHLASGKSSRCPFCRSDTRQGLL
ncbi:MAG: DUF433 domain-containing protein [Phycisphaerae bacterium]